jgi:hypothetical protein
MSLTKKRTLTAKRLAANRANGKRSHGPATAQGLERVRDSKLQHGFYSKDGDKALRALGEDPGEFAAVVKSVWEEWAPASRFQEELVMRLARAIWRMNRADRMQEGYALRQAQEALQGRETRLHARMMRLKMLAGSLQSLAESVAEECYVTTPKDLELMKDLHGERELGEMGQIALGLFCQLREPHADNEDGSEASSLEAQRKVLIRIKEIFGLSDDKPAEAPASSPLMDGQQAAESGAEPADASPGPAPATDAADSPSAPLNVRKYPHITAEEWEAREPVRQLLENILARQAEICETQRRALMRECLAGPSTFERAAEIAPVHPNSRFMQRMEDSSFRQVWRFTHMLRKLQGEVRQAQARESSAPSLKADENTEI